jgi:hypothetical protein
MNVKKKFAASHKYLKMVKSRKKINEAPSINKAGMRAARSRLMLIPTAPNVCEDFMIP